jgi:hypothetical protein
MFDPAYAHNALPAYRKLGAHRNSHPICYTPAVLDYFKALCLLSLAIRALIGTLVLPFISCATGSRFH